MNENIFVVTKYRNNGESWGDEIHYEEPIEVFKTIESARMYCKSKGELMRKRFGTDKEKYKVRESEDYNDSSYTIFKIYPLKISE